MSALSSLKAVVQAIGADVKSINASLSGKQDKLTFDTTPTSDSSNPVTSGGVSNSLSGAVGVVKHGTNSTAPRPSGYGCVYWIGSATPSNAVDGDIWRNA